VFPLEYEHDIPDRQKRGLALLRQRVYPVPQNVLHVRAEMNVLDGPEGPHPKAMDVSPWYGVYSDRYCSSLKPYLVIVFEAGDPARGLMKRPDYL